MRKRILLADDHPTIRKSVRAALDGGYELCGEATNGREAIERAIELKPDLILLDMSMPGMSGIDAAREIRRILPATKILMFSVHDPADIVSLAKSAGADGARQ